MQIDASDEQCENANASIRETVEPASNATFETNLFPDEQREPNDSIPAGIIITSPNPKHLMIEQHSKFIRNPSMLFK
jgi:hypothetical protein